MAKKRVGVLGWLTVAMAYVNTGCGNSSKASAESDKSSKASAASDTQTPSASAQAAPVASAALAPVKVYSSLRVMFPGWEKYDFQKPEIVIDGMMTGKSGGEADMFRALVNCKMPSPNQATYWEVPGQWNCEVTTYRPFPGGARSIDHDYFGQKPGYYGDFYWPHDKDGKLVPAEEQQPRLIDAGTGLLFPDIDFQSPGSLRITCSQPLRDLARKTEHEFDGCTVAWKNMFVPDETHYEMTIGQYVTIPDVYVAAKQQ